MISSRYKYRALKLFTQLSGSITYWLYVKSGEVTVDSHFGHRQEVVKQTSYGDNHELTGSIFQSRC